MATSELTETTTIGETTIGEASRGERSYLQTLKVGVWQDMWWEGSNTKAQWRLVRIEADKPHEHPLTFRGVAERISYDDGCMVEFRVAKWQEVTE